MAPSRSMHWWCRAGKPLARTAGEGKALDRLVEGCRFRQAHRAAQEVGHVVAEGGDRGLEVFLVMPVLATWCRLRGRRPDLARRRLGGTRGDGMIGCARLGLVAGRLAAMGAGRARVALARAAAAAPAVAGV